MRMLNLVRRLIRDQRGNTPANLSWILLILGFSGITIDTVRAFQMKTMMQATADAGALGAALELPATPETAPAMAVAMVDINMPSSLYGNLTTEDEVLVGRWNADIDRLNVGATPPNAAWVTLRRATGRGNSFGTSLLTLVGVTSWDISVQSIAFVAWRDCASSEGIVAEGFVDFNSVNNFGDNFCVYGREGVKVNNGNDFTGEPLGGDGTGALIGMGNDAYLNYGCDGVYHQGGGGDPCDWGEANPGMREGHFHSDDVYPSRLNDFDAAAIAEYQSIFDSDGVGVDPDDFYTEGEWRATGNNFDEDLHAEMTTASAGFREYYFQCSNKNRHIKLNSGNYSDMLIVTNCPIDIIGSSSNDSLDHGVWRNVTIVTVADENVPDNPNTPPTQGVNMEITGGNKFGTGCDASDAVRFYSSESIQFAGNNRFRGVEVTAVNNLVMAGNQQSYLDDIGSFTAHVGGNVYFTSASDFVYCPSDVETVPVKARTSLVR